MISKAYEVYSARAECLGLYTKQSRVLLEFIDPVERVKWSQAWQLSEEKALEDSRMWQAILRPMGSVVEEERLISSRIV